MRLHSSTSRKVSLELSFCLIIPLELNFMPITLSNPIASKAIHESQPTEPPEDGTHNAVAEAHAVQPSAQTGPNGAPGAGYALADAVHGAEDRGMRRAVVDEDRGGGEGEGAADDLDEQHAADGEPDEDAVLFGWWRGYGWYDGEEGDEGVGDREGEEEDPPGFDDAETCVHPGVDDELKRYSDEA